MDSITHTFSGLVIARLSKKSSGSDPLPLRTRMIVSVLATNAPDLDIVLAPFSPQLYLMHHRGISHSLVMLPIWALLLSWLFGKLFKHTDGWRAFYLLVAFSLLLHIGLDWLTGYGTQLFAPITTHRYALGSTFIIDPVMAGLFLLGGILPSFFKSSKVPAVVASILVLGWIGWETIMMRRAEEIGREYAASIGWQGAIIDAEARPIAPWNWTVIVRDGENYHYAHMHLRSQPVPKPAPDANWLTRALAGFHIPSQAQWHTASQFGTGADALLAKQVWEKPELKFFRWFAASPAFYGINQYHGQPCVWFQDLRFIAPGRDGPFRFGLCGPDWKAYRIGLNGMPVLYR
jgi:inner membrane protein